MSQGVDTRLCLPKTAWPPTSMNITPNSTKDDLANQFPSVFKIENLDKFSIEAEFANGTENQSELENEDKNKNKTKNKKTNQKQRSRTKPKKSQKTKTRK